MSNNATIFFIVFAFIMLSSCFSDEKKERVIIIDKSTGQENIKHFANVPEIKKAPTHPQKDKYSNYQKTKKKTIKKTKIKNKNVSIPVAAKIIKPFSKNHQGLSFGTKSGQTVRAINNGTVVYSGNKLKSRGKMIIIKHPLGFYSSYAHNQSLSVKSGDKVEKGQSIATTGDDNFYFEIKKFETLINPIKYIK